MKIKLCIILLFEILKIAFNLVLDDIQVYGGNYGSNYKFIIYGKSNETLNESIIKINISSTEIDTKEVECSIEKTETLQNLIYSCIYNENIDGGIFIEKQNNNISGIKEDKKQIKPLNLSIEYLEAKNLEFENEIWEYELKGKLNEPNQVYLGSICYMDIKINDTNAIAGCAIIDKNESQLLFNCRINDKNQSLSNKITIPKENTLSSTLKFNNLNDDNDMHIIAYKYVSFIEGKNLTFNKDKEKWEFSIIVSYQSIPVATKSIVDILFNGFLSSAICYSNDFSMLECVVNENVQAETDLVKIHFISSGNSTIIWNNLTYIYEIPIEKELTYKSLTKLKYTNVWSYTIKFFGTLPENCLVTINIKINGNSTLNKCYYINPVLNCKTENTNQDDTLKLSYEKNGGSIKWKNIIKRDIPFTINVNIFYENSFNLYFDNDIWIFILNVRNYTNNYRNLGISIGIKYGEDQKEGVAYCLPKSNDSNLFDCEAFYENQNENDLIIIYGGSSDVSVTWLNSFIEKKITSSAQLNFSKAYDLEYSDDKWHFKIEVDNNLPNGSKLIVDILYDEIYNDTATCIYNNTILSCERDSSNQKPTESLILKREKGSGSITWKGIEKEKVTMPITIKRKLIKAYDLIFSENWNFYLEIQNIGVVPNNAYFLLDILHNSEEKTAKCELSNKTHTDDISIMFCYLDIKGQSRRDIININIKKKHGSIFWSNNETNFNGTILELSTERANFFLKKAYNMEFVDYIWEFTLIGNIGRNSLKGEIFIIEIKYILLEGEFDSIAKCWSEGGFMNEDIYFLCNVEYEYQTDKGLIQLKYFQSESSTLIWNGGIEDNHQITLKGVSLILVKAYDMTLDKTWKFRIDVEGGSFPSGAQIVIDIFIGNKINSIYCSSLNNSLIICDSNTSSLIDSIRISNETLSNSSVKWTENRQDDFLIFVNAKFEYISVYSLIFNITINKWTFIIEKKGEIPLGSKLIVDIKYNNLSSIAKCFNNITVDVLNCFVEEEEQKETDLVQLNHIKSKRSSITWTNLKKDEHIVLISNLTIKKTLNLERGINNYWIFKIIIEEDIPYNSKVIIDIFYKINSVLNNSTAICYYNNKILSCTTGFNGSELIIIKLTKTKNSLSSITWKKMEEDDNDKLLMNITESMTYINFTNFTKIIQTNNKYYFHINLDNEIPQEGTIVIDIEIDNITTISLCIAETTTKLKCEINNEYYKNNSIIYLISKSSEYSTGSWKNLNINEKKMINYINLGFLGAYNKTKINNSFYEFKILTTGKSLIYGTKIYVRIKITKGTITSYESIPCYSQEEFLICTVNIENQASSNFDFKLDFSSEIKNNENVLWTIVDNNPTTIYEKNNYNLDFEINSFSYNHSSNCYEFTFEDKNDIGIIIFFIIDIKIGEQNTYAYCKNIGNNIYCKTKKIEYNEKSEIKVIKSNNYGNVNWTNLIEDQKINLLIVDISQVYNLHFQNNSWKFTIELFNKMSTNKTFLLDIFINDTNGSANCTLNNGILDCEVISEYQNEYSLIKLSSNIKGDIKLNNFQSFIPLNIKLEFNNIYDLLYEGYYNNRDFKINCTINEEKKIIPENSTFTVDIKYDSNKNMAECKKDNITGQTMILSCKTKIRVPFDSLISLSNNKSNYSSITWENGIPDNLEVFISTNLNVKNVINLIYNNNTRKWNFDINLNKYYYNYPLNSKVKIDLKYNEENITATCVYTPNNQYKFLCIPNVENQNETDYFEIIKNKKQGTVTYSITNEKDLIILSSPNFKFIRAYDLIYNNSKWNFKIKVSDGYLLEKRSTLVEFRVDYFDYYNYYNYYNHYYKTAICIFNSSIVLCQSLSDNDKYDTRGIYLVNNRTSGFIKWSNLFKNEPIYVTLLNITLNNVFGCYMNKKWKFNIKYEDPYKRNYINNHVLVDILVNNKSSTGICVISNENVLKCESNHSNQNLNDTIEIIGDKEPNSGTIYFGNISNDNNNNKKVKPFNITLNQVKINSTLFSNETLFIYIYGFMENNNEYNAAATFTEIELLINKTYNGKIKSRASCEITFNYDKNTTLKCTVDSLVSKNEITKINIDSSKYSKYVKFLLGEGEDKDLNINTSYYADIKDDPYSESIITDLVTYRDYKTDYKSDHNSDYNSDYKYNPVPINTETPFISDISNDTSFDNNSTDSNNNKNKNNYKIIGGIIGGVVGVIIIVFIIYIIKVLKHPTNIVNNNQNQNQIENINNNINQDYLNSNANMNRKNYNLEINQA